MTKTVKKLGSELSVGMKIWEQGGLYEITKITYDPHGNTGNSPRYLVNGKWIKGANRDFFPNDMQFGLRTDLNWTVDAS